MATKRKSLCIDEKVSIIRAIKNGTKITEIARRLGLNSSTVSTIWKNREKVLQAGVDGMNSKRARKPKFYDLDQALLLWYYKQRNDNMLVSGPILRAAAENIAEQLGINNFKISEGWLGRFRRRHCIIFGKNKSEEQDIDTNFSDDWINRVWPTLKDKYAPSDIFNADEALIFFDLTPDKTLNMNGEIGLRGILTTEHMSILIAANMKGTEKRKLLVIGKSKNSRCLANIKQLPVTYKANKSAWMTSQLFEEELQRWDAELNGRKILLLVSNCPVHPRISNLRNIELSFLPDLQPMNQSVIRSLKSHYRRKVLMELIVSEGKTFINMLNAVTCLSRAWEEVTAKIIQQSFLEVGLRYSSADDEVETETKIKSEYELPLVGWIKEFLPEHQAKNVQNYTEIDDNLAITASITEEEIRDTEMRGVEEQQENEQDGADGAESPSIQTLESI